MKYTCECDFKDITPLFLNSDNAKSCNTVMLVYMKCLTHSPPIFWRTGLNEIRFAPKFVPIKNITESTGYHIYHDDLIIS